MESLIGSIQNFPYEDPQYEKLQEDMERVRAKFRQVMSSNMPHHLFVKRQTRLTHFTSTGVLFTECGDRL